MQTTFTPEQLTDPGIQRANEILRSCVHCGFCTATCPTYQVLGDELDSPRGRIYLIKDMLEQGRPADEKTVKHIKGVFPDVNGFGFATTSPVYHPSSLVQQFQPPPPLMLHRTRVDKMTVHDNECNEAWDREWTASPTYERVHSPWKPSLGKTSEEFLAASRTAGPARRRSSCSTWRAAPTGRRRSTRNWRPFSTRPAATRTAADSGALARLSCTGMSGTA